MALLYLFYQLPTPFLILKTLLESALEENKLLKLEVARLRKSRFACSCKSSVHQQLFQKDKDVHFYTGISSLSIFHKLHSFISKYVRQTVGWTKIYIDLNKKKI